MKHLWTLGIIGAALLALQCKDEAQQVQPAAQGQRGEACQARNDCQSGLACILGVCSKNDFQLTSSAKQCDRIDCQTDTDCCGTRPSVAPPKCDNRAIICQTPSLPGCTSTVCTSSASCGGGGTCPTGYCSNTAGACTSSADCADTCVEGICSVSGLDCSTNATICTYNGSCSTRYCACANPQYSPSSSICSDPDCVNLCTLECLNERCVQDTSCTTNANCLSGDRNICSAGNCVECVEDDDCDTTKGEQCRKNACKKPCTANEECPLFQGCQNGDCVQTGCKSDRECVLAANMSNTQTQTGGVVVRSNEDARLIKCLPSDADPKINTCKVPCENDGACGSQFQICDSGYCRFIGCETDEECRGYLGIVSEMVTDAKPFISHAVCRE
jgi:hypothetical protein